MKHALIVAAALAAATLNPAAPANAHHDSDPWRPVRGCESGDNYATNTGNGYYGAYQFSISTWNAVAAIAAPAYVGVRPDLADRWGQDRMAQALAFEIGWGGLGHWPVCGQYYNAGCYRTWCSGPTAHLVTTPTPAPAPTITIGWQLTALLEEHADRRGVDPVTLARRIIRRWLTHNNQGDTP